MRSDSVKARLLLAVAAGSTVSAAGAAENLTRAQASDSIFRLCRSLQLPADIKRIRADRKTYSQAAANVLREARSDLRGGLRREMKERLRLRSLDELTIGHVSTLTASAVLAAGITEVGLAEIQEWLVKNGSSLKRSGPSTLEDTKRARRAMYLLDAFGLDVSNAKSALLRTS